MQKRIHYPRISLKEENTNVWSDNLKYSKTSYFEYLKPPIFEMQKRIHYPRISLEVENINV